MRRRRLIGVYRGLRKSIVCRDSIKQSAAGPGGATRNTEDLPDRPGNLADSHPEHNRRRLCLRGGAMPPLRHVDLSCFPRYARWDQSEFCEASMTTFDKREEGFEKKFAHDEEL